MSETEDGGWKPSCYDCGFTPHDPTALGEGMVHIDREDGGYDRVPVPMCRDCRAKRHGHDCPECGETYLMLEDAAKCCDPAPGEAPDCPECGRRMERGSWGYTADGKPTVEWAECEACNIGWGKYTGFHDLDAEEGTPDAK